MRRRRRTAVKPPPVSDTEYFSDSHTIDEPASTTPHSELDSSDEPESDGHQSDGPIASGSKLPPPSPTPDYPGDLNVSAKADSPEHTSQRAWYEFDLFVVLALLSPIANWLTGCDYVKNILLILLLVFYLHHIIEVPWNLYLASRPRRALSSSQDIADKQHHAASSELQKHEIFYLTLSFLSPFVGATLLRAVVTSFAGPSTVSWFSLSLFVLATGIRPWKHAIHRLRERTADLHTTIHYPPSQAQSMEALVQRVAQLETELKSLRKQTQSFNSELYGHMEDSFHAWDIAARRQEKKAEVSKAFMEGRLMKLEENVEALLERMEIRADRPVLFRTTAQISTIVSAMIELLTPFLPAWILAHCRGNAPRSPRSSPKISRSRSSVKLETIPEVATFQPKCPSPTSPYFHIPGVSLALRIGDLATFPLRRTLAYLIAGRIYAPRTRASL